MKPDHETAMPALPHHPLREMQLADYAAAYDLIARQAVTFFNLHHALSRQEIFLVQMGAGAGEVVRVARVDAAVWAPDGDQRHLPAFVRGSLYGKLPLQMRDCGEVVPMSRPPDFVVQVCEGEALVEDAVHDPKDVVVIALHARFGSSAQVLPVTGDPRQIAWQPFNADSFGTRGRYQMAEVETIAESRH
jgi:hypothetical protein